MEDDSSKKPQRRRPNRSAKPRRGRPNEVQVTFWTLFEKREDMRTLRRVQGRTSKSIMNEAIDLLIAKYTPP